MARVTEYGNTGNGRSNQDNQDSQNNNVEVIAADQDGPIQVPGADFIRDADITREGQDLILETPDGSVVVIEGYFNADPAPMITSPDGSALTPKLVHNFVQEHGPVEYARADSVIDQSAVGEVLEITGQANVVRANGSTEPLTIGTPIYQGDIIETEAEGAVNIEFIDESTFAVSENARLAIDEYVFDPSTESGSTNFSVLRGIFVFTSGLIGRDDPDDVQIDTPVGSIGIRGTTIMGNVDTGEISVIEGAIVLRSYSGKEMTLDEQFETGKFDAATGEIIDMGKKSSGDISSGYESISGVMPSLFSSFEDSGDSADNSATDETQTADMDANTGQPSTAEGDDSTTEETSDADTQQAAAETTNETTETSGETDETAETAATTETITTETEQTAILEEEDDVNFDVATDTTLDGTSTDTQTNTTTSGSTSSGTGTTSTSTTTTTTTSTTTSDPATLLPLDLEINRLTIDNDIADGDTIAVINTTSDFSSVDYRLNDTLDGTIDLFKGPDGEAVIKLISGPLTIGDTLNISVTATVPDGRSITEQYGVDVVDMNDAPTITNSGSIYAIDEDAALNDPVGTVGATDPEGDTLTYTITGGDPNNAFSIDAAGNITVSNELDYETVTDYNLTIAVSDGSLTDTATYTINIGDINEAPVVSNNGSAFTVNENAQTGDAVGAVNATDPEGDTLTYTITGGDPNNAFSIDTAGNIVVSGTLDYETVTSYSLNVAVSDGALTDTATYTINIGDIDDEPATITANGGLTLNEGMTVTITNADLKATDIDTATSDITYTIMTAPANGQIELTTDPGTAVMSFTQADIDASKVVYAHDGSATSTDSFYFNVSDGVNATQTGTFNLTIDDVTPPTLVDSGTHKSGLSGLTARDTGIHLHFDEDIQVGAGDIRIMNSGGVVETIAITDPRVTIDGQNLHVELNTLLNANTDYYVEIDNGAITDLSGNAYGGITDNVEFTFTTGRATFMTTVGGLGADAAKGVLEIFDPVNSDGYIVIGDSVRNGQSDITVTKYDHHGFVQEVTTIGGTGNEHAADIAHNASGIFIGGTTNDAVGAGSQDFMLSSLDASGNLNWTHVYGSAADESLSAITSVNGSTNIAMAGTVNNADSSGLVTMVNGTDGSILWETNLSQALSDIATKDVLGPANGKYGSDLLVGGNHSANNGDIIISRIDDANGAIQWFHNIDVNNSVDQLNAMTELDGGNIALAGSTTFGDLSNEQGLLVHLNTGLDGSAPEITWAVTVGAEGSIESITDVIELSDGSLAVVGRIGGNDGFVANIDAADGSILWARSLEHGTGQVSLSSLEQAADGSLVISGETTAAGAGSSDAFTLGMTRTGGIENTGGTLIDGILDDGILGNGWTITDQSGIAITQLTPGTDITIGAPGITADNTTATVTNTEWTGLESGDGSDVDHVVDILGDTDGVDSYVGTSNPDSANFTGQNGTFSGFAGNDVFTIDGYDIVNMGSGDDTVIFNGSNDGAVIHLDELGYIDGGSGSDVFSLSTRNDLDLSALHANDDVGLGNIEILDLNSSSDVTVKLTYEAIISITDDNNTLIIDGTNADAVEFDFAAYGGTAGTEGTGGSTPQTTNYQYYDLGGGVSLYIDDTVNTVQA